MSALPYCLTLGAAGPDQKVSTNPSRPCVCACAGILTSAERSEGLTSPGGSALASESEASLGARTRQGCVAPCDAAARCMVRARCAHAKCRRGVSAWKLAVSIRRRLMFGALHDRRRGADRPLAFSVTLTCRSGDESDVRAKLADFVRVVGKRAPRVGLLCALDRAPSGAWHVHVLALLPPTLAPEKLIVWWCRCWANRKLRPVRCHVRAEVPAARPRWRRARERPRPRALAPPRANPQGRWSKGSSSGPLRCA